MKIKVLDKNCIPVKAHSIDAGFDLKARKETSVFPQDTEYIPTGVCVEIPVGYVGLLFPRSSISKTPLRMCNSVGVIDSGFTGEIKVPLQNTHHNLMVRVNQYDKIAQLVIVPLADVSIEIVDELEESERGNGGFGSTGR
nr:MAG TPA: dUTPase [Caudoviricetes sp.]